MKPASRDILVGGLALPWIVAYYQDTPRDDTSERERFEETAGTKERSDSLAEGADTSDNRDDERDLMATGLVRRRLLALLFHACSWCATEPILAANTLTSIF